MANAVVWSIAGEESESLKLANRLGIELYESNDPPETGEWTFFYDDGVLFLYSPVRPEYKPMCIDYLSGEFARRWRRFTRDDLLYKAMGIKKGNGNWRILDATCGLGYDAFYLATLPEVEVTTCERNLFLAELVMDALLRVKEEEQFEDFPLFFSLTDSLELIKKSRLGDFDTIYLDPMYPRSESQSAKQKKELLWIRDLVGEDLDAKCIFLEAQKLNPKRIVVKRPDKAELLVSDPKPDFQLHGNTVRFDIYLSKP